MKRTLLLLSLLATCGLHGAIKKAEDARRATPPAAKPAEPGEEKRPSATSEEDLAMDLAKEFKKRAQRHGRKPRLEEEDFAEALRSVLERNGVPAEKLKTAGVVELLELLEEKSPGLFRGLGFGGMSGFDSRTEKKLNDHFQELLDGHKPGAAIAARATFLLRDAKQPAAPLEFATGIRADGWLLTKASEIAPGAELQCQIQGGWVAAKIVRTWEEYDVALLKVAATDLPAVKWAEGAMPEVGSFITAAAPEGRDPVAIGVVSVLARNLQTKGRGFLGVKLESDDKGLKILEIVAGSPAKNSGMQTEDRILELDGKKPDSMYNFTRMVSDRKAGDKVRLKLQRGEAIVEKEIALADRAAMIGAGRGGPDKMNSMGSTLSRRKTDFPSAMQTDLPLQSTQCGGPVADLDGNVVGLVIARSGRVETMVLPSGTIRELLAGVDFSKEGQPAAPKPDAPAVAK